MVQMIRRQYLVTVKFGISSLASEDNSNTVIAGCIIGFNMSCMRRLIWQYYDVVGPPQEMEILPACMGFVTLLSVA